MPKEKIRVSQWDLAGNKIAEFSSYEEAERTTHILAESIGRVVRGKQKTAGGFIWKKVENELEK